LPLRDERQTATTWEAAIVLGIPVIVFLEYHLRAIWAQEAHGQPVAEVMYSDVRLLRTLGWEVVMAGALLWWLSRRGWRPARVLGMPNLRDVLRGAVLWCATFAVVRCTNLLLAAVAPGLYNTTHDAPLQGALSWPVYLAALAINPIFEEMLWLGYAVPALGRAAGIRVAALVSVGLRVAVHVPQGGWALVSVLPLAAVWTGYFLWQRRLWPVVVAHVINNAFGLGEFVEAPI